MVLRLIDYVLSPRFTRRCVYRENAITVSPSFPVREMRVYTHKFAAFSFQQPYEISYCQLGRDVAQYMDMVWHSAYASYVNFTGTRKIIHEFV